MRRCFWILAVVCLISVTSADEQIDAVYYDFLKGHIAQAQKDYRLLPQSTVRDGNRLFLSALFEPDGRRAFDLLEAALRTDLDGKYKQESRFRMIQLAAAFGDKTYVLSAGDSFLNRWEMSDFRDQVLALMAVHAPKLSSEEKRYLDLLVDGFPGTYLGQCARLMEAHAAFERRHYKTAGTLCRRINNSSEDNLTPASLILLSRIALAKGESERALLNYNILREQYRHAIGQDKLLSELKNVSEKQSGQESTEVFEGITYSVQVGVFGDRSNAKRMADLVKAYGYKARIKKRKISDNQYHVVLAGHFATMKMAQEARQKLELGENEVFKVVVNDEK